MQMRIALLLALVLVLSLSCSDNFNSSTGIYSNEDEGFEIVLPTGWEKAENKTGVLFIVKNETNTARIALSVQELPGNYTVEKYVQAISLQVRRGGARIIENGDTIIAGMNALWIKNNLGNGNQQFTAKSNFVMNGNKVYTVVCSATSNEFTDFETLCNRTVDSFSFK